METEIPLRSILFFLLSAGGGLLLGLMGEKVLLSQLQRLAVKTKWQIDDIIIQSMRGVVYPWFVIGGFYWGLRWLTLRPEVAAIADKSLFIALVLLATFMVSRLTLAVINYFNHQVDGVLPNSSLISNLARIMVFIGGFLMILQSLGVSITPILTALGVGGLAVALALQDTLANLFAGVHVLLSRQIRPGDFVKLESGEEGYVADITWRNTTIRMLPNNLVIIPNSKISSSLITNYYLPEKEMAVLVQVGVAYGSDLARVEAVTIEVGAEVMREVAGGIASHTPFIRYHTFADFSINFSVILRGGEFTDQYLIKHEFIKRLHERYHREGIEIPFPIRTVRLQPSAGEKS